MEIIIIIIDYYMTYIVERIVHCKIFLIKKVILNTY